MKTLGKICILLSILVTLSCGSGSDGDSTSSERPASGPGPSDTATRDITDIQSAKDALYAAYAGISYGNADNQEDNSLFYNTMFYNLNNTVGYLAFKAIPPQEFSVATITELIQQFVDNDIRRPYQEQGVSEELHLTGSISFSPPQLIISGHSYVDFNTDGSFSYNDWSWFEESNGSDPADSEVEMIIVGEMVGYMDDSTMSAVPNISSISIDTSEALSARYNKYKVQYKNWHLEYSANTDETDYTMPNLYILPVVGNYTSTENNPDYPDNRQYSVSGSFIINNKTYTYGEGFTYKQTSQTTGTDEDDNPITKTTISIDGSLSIPGNEGYMVITSSDIYPIVRNENGVIKSGMLFIGGKRDFAEVEFNDGDATIYFGSQSENVSSWQTTLHPTL